MPAKLLPTHPAAPALVQTPGTPSVLRRLLRRRQFQQARLPVALRRWLLMGYGSLGLAFWLLLAMQEGGLFRGSMGADFAAFWAATHAFVAEGAAAAYSPASIATYAAHLPGLNVFSHDGSLQVLPAPYPPIFFAMFVPFAFLPPTLGFAAWTAVNLVAIVVVCRRLSTRYETSALALVLASGAFYPLAISLYTGQPGGLVLLLFELAYTNLVLGREFTAGIWLGVLLIKPQYAALLLLMIVVQKRWTTFRGVVIAGSMVVLSSPLILGLAGLRTYDAVLGSLLSFRAAPAGVYPAMMTSWRGLLVNLLPGTGEQVGIALSVLLSLLTVALTLWIVRQPRNATEPVFAERMCLLMCATLLTAFYGQIHGAVLLIVPFVALLGSRRAGHFPVLVVIVGLLLPYAVLLMLHHAAFVPITFTSLVLVTFGYLAVRALVNPSETVHPASQTGPANGRWQEQS
jgi:hypothetical protein